MVCVIGLTVLPSKTLRNEKWSYVGLVDSSGLRGVEKVERAVLIYNENEIEYKQ